MDKGIDGPNLALDVYFSRTDCLVFSIKPENQSPGKRNKREKEGVKERM